MRKYLYFLASDAPHLQRRLERLAERGLELTDTEGLFCGQFERTERQGLQYAVVSCGRANDFPTEEICRSGWTLVGGFNGMAIFRSLPCAEADRSVLIALLEQAECVRPDHWTAPLMVVLSVAFAVLMFGAAAWFNFGAWYASYYAFGVALFRWVAAALAAANLVTLRSYASAWVHGLTPWVILLGVLFPVLVMAQLDNSQSLIYFAGILSALALACGLTFWKKARVLGISLSGICLAALCVGLLFPNLNRTENNGVLRSWAADRPVVQLSDIGDDTTLTGSGYTTDGTFLARRTEYWEMSDHSSVTTIFTDCLTDSIAQQVLDQTLSTGMWTQTDYGWESREGKAVLICHDTLVVQIICGEALSAEQITSIQNELFT